MTTTEDLFIMDGFTKGGGIWGDAYWRRLNSRTIISFSTEAMVCPATLDEPVQLYIYTGARPVEWQPGRDAEAPMDADCRMIEFESSDHCLAFIAATWQG
jgi:hypothetical protein